MGLSEHLEQRQPGWCRYGLGLVAILVTGLALRLYAIGSESLWLDEGFSALAAIQPTLGDVLTFIYERDLHPPLYYLVLHCWIGWFGDSETAMRILSAIFGTLSIPLVYRLGRDLMDRKTAVLAAMLTAVCVYQIYFAQEVRGYSLFAFLALLSMVFWIRLFVRPGFATVAGYVACTVLTLYSHPYGVFHVACQNILFVVLWLLERPLRLGWPGWIGIQSLLGLAFSPWIAVTLRNIRWTHHGQAPMLIPGVWDIPGALKAFAGDADFIATWSGERFWLGGLFVVLMLAGLWPARWGRKSRTEEAGNLQEDSPVRRRGILWVSVWLACTILIPYTVSMLSVPVFSSRYMISGSFAFLLLVAHGVQRLPGRPLRWGVAVGVILSQVSMLAPYYTQVNKEQWRQVAAYVESAAQPGDLLVFHAPYYRSCIYWYYARRKDLVEKEYPSRSGPEQVNPGTIREELLPLLEGRDRVFLILGRSYDNEGLIQKTFEQSFVCTESLQLYRASVWLYARSVSPFPSTETEMLPSVPAVP